MARFVKEGGFRFPLEHDPKTDEYVFRVHSNLQPPVPPPPRTSALVGDILNNLRSALDYVVWQLAESPSLKNQFPIFSTPKGFEGKCKRYLHSVPAEHWAAFEAYQPYPGRDANAELGRLATLNDADKHRLLLPGIPITSTLKGRFTVGGEVESITVSGREWIPFEDGAEVYRIKINGPRGNVQVKAEAPYSVVFVDSVSGKGAMIQDLRNMRIVVSNVVESFAPLF